MSTSRLHVTTCVLDCPDGCALEVEIEDEKIRRIGPAKDQGTDFICGKVARFDKRVYHEERIVRPLRRTGPKGSGQFEAISWKEAIKQIANKLLEVRQTHGGEAILPYHYGGSNGALTEELLDDLFFARLGASRLAKTICAVPATEVAVGMYGKMPGVAFEDYPKAECIVIWGANPKGSNIHLVPQLREARKQGAFVVSIDPRRNFAASEIDFHLPVLPGQDLPLALGLINRWRQMGHLDIDFIDEHTTGVGTLLERASEWPIERAALMSGVRHQHLEMLADRLAEASPAIIRCGWGLERNRNGAQAIAAVLAIPALLGKFGIQGGGYTLSNNGGSKFDAEALIGDVEWSTRELNMTQLGRLIDPETVTPIDPGVHCLFVYNANPVASTPAQQAIERGLGREDLFTVVHDQVMTDTARWADVVLPAATFLEGTDLRVSYGDYVAGGIRPAVEPAGEAKTNMQVFRALARELGMLDRAFRWEDDELLERAAGKLELDGVEADSKVGRGGRQNYSFSGGRPVQFGTVRPGTADGKAHLTPDQLGADPYVWQEPDTRYPLALITPASAVLTNSMFGESSIDTLRITLHPGDAGRRGLVTGGPVRVFNHLGEVHCHVEVSEKVRPGVASMPKGAWKRSSINGATSTALCPDDAQVVGDAACFNDARVEVEPLEA